MKLKIVGSGIRKKVFIDDLEISSNTQSIWIEDIDPESLVGNAELTMMFDEIEIVNTMEIKNKKNEDTPNNIIVFRRGYE